MTGQRSNGHLPFDPNELGTGDHADVADALQTARRLEASIDDAPITTGARFSDRVMAALADEPTPAPAGFLTPLRRRGLIVGFGTSIRQAWASIGAPGRPTFARAAALAYVLAIAIAGTSLAGAATITVAGALGILGPHQAEPTPTLPSPVTSPEPSRQPAVESESPGPEASEDPSEGPVGSDDHGGAGVEPSDDHGGGALGSGSGSSGGDGSGSGGDHASTAPTGGDGGDDHGGTSTPRPTETPRPSSTSSDGGSGGGSGSAENPS